jgi:hypothetical protein
VHYHLEERVALILECSTSARGLGHCKIDAKEGVEEGTFGHWLFGACRCPPSSASAVGTFCNRFVTDVLIFLPPPKSPRTHRDSTDELGSKTRRGDLLMMSNAHGNLCMRGAGAVIPCKRCLPTSSCPRAAAMPCALTKAGRKGTTSRAHTTPEERSLRTWCALLSVKGRLVGTLARSRGRWDMRATHSRALLA